MARRKKGKTGRVLLVTGVIGLGAWWLWKSGNWQRFYDAIMPAGAPGDSTDTDPAGGGASATDNIDENGDLAAVGIAALLAWLQSRSNPDEPDPSIDAEEPAVPISPDVPANPTTPTPQPQLEEPWTLNLPEWLAGVPAGGAALTLAETLGLASKVAVPLIIGTSQFVADVVHDVNLAIPGDNTGLEKGNITMFDDRGRPYIVTPEGSCFDLAGRPITCPSSVGGVSQPVLDYIGVEA